MRCPLLRWLARPCLACLGTATRVSEVVRETAWLRGSTHIPRRKSRSGRKTPPAWPSAASRIRICLPGFEGPLCTSSTTPRRNCDPILSPGPDRALRQGVRSLLCTYRSAMGVSAPRPAKRRRSGLQTEDVVPQSRSRSAQQVVVDQADCFLCCFSAGLRRRGTSSPAKPRETTSRVFRRVFCTA